MAKRKSKSKKQESIKRRVWELQSQCEHDGNEIWTPEIVSSVIAELEEEERQEQAKLEQEKKAFSLIDTTVTGIVTLASEEQLLKVYFSIDFTPQGMFTLDRLPQ